MTRRTIRGAVPPLALLLMLAAAGAVRADEFHLKDGSKIVGTIVGYENDSFKVQTSYGFALVRKDKIAEIIPSTPPKVSGLAAKPTASLAPETQPPTPDAVKDAPEIASPSNPEPKREVALTAISPPKPPSLPAIAAAKPPLIAASASLPTARIVTSADDPTPPAPSEPVVIHDEISGSLYLNHTYGFQMFKPPSWDLVPDARSGLPNAVAALGTDDQTTLLVIGLEPTHDSLAAHAEATEKALDEIYDNYRALSSRSTTIAGGPAEERRARGLLDGHDWSVIVVTFLHAGNTYTLLGMTWDNDDLIQMQENVIVKTMSSLTFVGH